MAEIAPMLAHFGYDPEGNARMAIIAFILTYYHCHMDGISLMRNNIKWQTTGKGFEANVAVIFFVGTIWPFLEYWFNLCKTDVLRCFDPLCAQKKLDCFLQLQRKSHEIGNWRVQSIFRFELLTSFVSNFVINAVINGRYAI